MPLPVGLVYDPAGHVILDPDTAIQGALRHLFTTFEATGSATAVVKAFRAAGLSFPWRHQKDPARARSTGSRFATTRCCGCCTTRATLARSPTACAATDAARRKRASIKLPRDQWTSFIPGAHPGYITLGQYQATLAELAANAAAHGRDRPPGRPAKAPPAAGHHRCGRCGGRMSVRYHTRGSRQVPTYACQRDGIENARPFFAVIPGHILDEHVGQLLIDTLTPLAAEAALQVSTELRQRAADADALRAAHVQRARAHADLARRRYLAVDPANGSSGTLEADSNTALRAFNDARASYHQALPAAHRNSHPGPEGPDRQLVTDSPGIWTTPPPRCATQAHRPAAAHRRHRHQDQRHHHRARPPGQRPDPPPHPPVPEPAWKLRQTPAATSPRSTGCWTTTPAPRSPASSAAATWPTAKDCPSPPPSCSSSSAPTRYAAAPAAARRRAEPPSRDGRAARRVHRHRRKTGAHARVVSRQAGGPTKASRALPDPARPQSPRRPPPEARPPPTTARPAPAQIDVR